MLLPVSWTTRIAGADAVSELKNVRINKTEHSFLIRGVSRKNPVVLFVHGGPGCSEIPYVVKYQRKLEKYFTIVHYDQRGSGKSFHAKEDYSDLTVAKLISDLKSIISYICQTLGKDKIILAGHSFGTEIAIRTAAEFPDHIMAYVGIGQMAYTSQSELEGLSYCLQKAKEAGQEKDYQNLLALREQLEAGKGAVPRSYIRKYGGAARLINDNRDYAMALLFRPEYSIRDAVKFIRGLSVSQRLFGTTSEQTAEAVRSLEMPCYFLQGAYDYMTSTKIAKQYFEEIQAPEKEFVLFERSAHFPQFEERDRYLEWMKGKFCS